jgi:sugar/nucleoside kinase (ribokinase family)
VAAITVSRRGAIPAIPSRSEVEHFLTSYQR